jgi:hypothetical protein
MTTRSSAQHEQVEMVKNVIESTAPHFIAEADPKFRIT